MAGTNSPVRMACLSISWGVKISLLTVLGLLYGVISTGGRNLLVLSMVTGLSADALATDHSSHAETLGKVPTALVQKAPYRTHFTGIIELLYRFAHGSFS